MFSVPIASRLRHALPWLSLVTILVSLASPLATPGAVTAAPDDDLPNESKVCPQGESWSEQTNHCEQVPTPTVEPPAPPECPEGQEPNGNGGCIPVQEPVCPEGQAPDDQGACQPAPCPEGMVYDDQGNCIPDPNQPPPDCSDGFVLDEDWACVPDPNQSPPECKDGEVYDEDIPGCVQQEPEPAASNTVTITYHQCAKGVTPSTDLEWLLNNCPVVEGVSFTGTFGERIETGKTDAKGQIAFTDLPLGKWSIEPVGGALPTPEPGEAGSIQMLAGCDIHIGLEVQNPLQFENVQRITGEFDRPGGIAWDCHWVDLVIVPHDSLDLTKYACPAGTDPAVPLAELQDTCTAASGVLFHLMDKHGSTDRTTDASGHAAWTGLGHSGYAWWLREQVPAGYGQPVVWCRTVPAGPWTQLEAPAAQVTIAYPVEGGSGMECQWFNLLASEQGVFIRTLTYICPYGTSATLYEGEWREVCWPGEEVAFTASFNGTMVTRTTAPTSSARTHDSDGTIEWGQVPVGPWTMTETRLGTIPPYLYTDTEPIVFCHFVNPPAGSTIDTAIFARTPSGMSVSGTYTADHRGQYLSCTWVNILGRDLRGSAPNGPVAALLHATRSWSRARQPLAIHIPPKAHPASSPGHSPGYTPDISCLASSVAPSARERTTS